MFAKEIQRKNVWELLHVWISLAFACVYVLRCIMLKNGIWHFEEFVAADGLGGSGVWLHQSLRFLI
jgi:hypothetical protein